MQMSMTNLKSTIIRRIAVAALAVGIIGSLAAFNLAKAAPAALPTPAPAAAALDDNSVAALLTLDRAMETHDARDTPAVVNGT